MNSRWTVPDQLLAGWLVRRRGRDEPLLRRLGRVNSAVICPSRMTRMRSAIPRISGISVDMKRMPMPRCAMASIRR